MKVVILHISDIHIKDESDPILGRAQELGQSVFRYLPDCEALFIVITGDIAFSGISQQYDCADKFINDIVHVITSEKEVPIHILMAPGNHDCDFSGNNSVRDAVISAIASKGGAGVDDELITECIKVQGNYDEFRKRIEDVRPVSDDSLWKQYEYQVGGIDLIFDSINVAWTSTLHEAQGRLIFPIKRYENIDRGAANLRVILFHHPLNWYSQSIYRDFRTKIWSLGDLILTGHEHVQGVGETDDAISDSFVYIEGAALQPENSSEASGFNVVEIDLDNFQYKCDLFRWVRNKYEIVDLVQSWSSYRKLPEKRSNEFTICAEFIRILDDPGANFTHPEKQSLILSDFYIYPDLEEIIDDGQDNRLISSSILKDASSIDKLIVIKGDEKSGKTALLKTLFSSYHESGYVPLLVDAQDIGRASDRELDSVIEKSIENQYCKRAVKEWERLSKARKILLLDGIERCPVKDQYRHKVIGYYVERFGSVILTSDITLDVSEVTSQEAADVLSKFKHYEIRPYGYKLRGELINKWARLGCQHNRATAEFIDQVDRLEKCLNAVVGACK